MSGALHARWDAVLARIDSACRRVGREPAAVKLVAVSKTVPATLLAEILGTELRDLGESYLREAIDKQSALGALAHRAVWHHIGALQSNKTAGIAEHFDWVHGVERIAIAERLSRQRGPARPALNVCVQINISGELRKSGCAPAEAAALCAAVARQPNLRLRGLMAIPAAVQAPQENRPVFAQMATLYRKIQQSGSVDPRDFDTLSMGMSGDFEAAIEEGATLVRIGQGIFGARQDT